MALIDDETDKILFEYIFHNHQKQMYEIANGILHNREDAEDAVQNALLNIARHMANIPKGNTKLLHAYVYTTTRNAALLLLRKKSRDVETVPIEDLPLSSDEDPIDNIIHWDDYKSF